jgi:hypothetical protein
VSSTVYCVGKDELAVLTATFSVNGAHFRTT